MHHGDGLGAGSDQRSDGGGCDGTGIGIHIGEHRLGTKQHGAGGCGDEGAWRGDQLVTLTKANGQIGSGESQGAIGYGDGMTAATPLSELVLKSLCFLARPGVHLAGGKHTSDDIDLVAIELRPGGKKHGCSRGISWKTKHAPELRRQ